MYVTIPLLSTMKSHDFESITSTSDPHGTGWVLQGEEANAKVSPGMLVSTRSLPPQYMGHSIWKITPA